MLKAIFPKNTREISLFGLTQWDKGQKVAISFENMPERFQVHFSSKGSDEAYVVDVKSSEGAAVAEIPDELLTKGSDIDAWIYITSGDKGETIGKATLYVKPRAEPIGYMESLVPSQQKLVENMITDLQNNLKYVMENGINSQYIPEYVTKEAQCVANNVLSVQNENTITFAALSDIHLDPSDYYSKKSLEHASIALKLIRSMCKLDFVAVLGDNICDSSDSDLSDATEAFLTVNTQLSDAIGTLPQLRAIGAEDMLIDSYLYGNDYLDLSKLYSLIGKWCYNATFNSEDESASYCYLDFPEKKYRLICLNTSDIKPGSEISTDTSKATISLEQLNWFCEALKLSDKQDSADWKILIFSHYPLNYFESFPLLEDIIKAYNNSSKVELIYDGANELSWDFTQCGGKIVAMFNGELHNFKVNTFKDTAIPMITIPNVSSSKNNLYFDEKYTSTENLLYGEDVTYDKTEDSGKDTAFCLVTIDRNKNAIYAHCYGAGYDRTINFTTSDSSAETPDSGDSGDSDNSGNDSKDDDTEQGGNNQGSSEEAGTNNDAYTNLVPSSTDENGDIFSIKGYSNGFYIDDSGAAVAKDGFTCTGYIPVNSGDLIYIKGGTAFTSPYSNIAIFDSDYNILGTLPITGEVDEASGIYYLSGLVIFDSEMAPYALTQNAKYIRISFECDGKDLIVTANEKIPSSDSSDSSGSSGSSDSSSSSGATSYSNIIGMSLDGNGDIYNDGLGYCDDMALDNTGAEFSKEGYCVTGYFESSKDSILRFKNYGLSDEECNCLAFYDDGLNFLYSISFMDETDLDGRGVTFSNGVLTLDLSAITLDDLSDDFNVRLSTKALGESLIVTYNEEIG